LAYDKKSAFTGQQEKNLDIAKVMFIFLKPSRRITFLIQERQLMNTLKTVPTNLLKIVFMGLIILFSTSCDIDTIEETLESSSNTYEYFSRNASLPVAEIDREYTPEEQQNELERIEALIDKELIGEYRQAWADRQEEVYSDSINGDNSRRVISGGGNAGIHFNSKNPFMDTHINAQSGKTYNFSARELDTWKDFTTPASVEGWTTMKWLANIYWIMARTKASGFYYLTGCIKNGSNEYYFQIGKSCTITAPFSGRLYLFVNDVPGFFWNNKGTAMVNVSW